MNKILLLTFSIASILLLNTSCTKEKTPEPIPEVCVNDTILFSTRVQPIIDMSCATSGCHDAGGSSGGYVFENHTQISSNIDIILKTINHDPSVVPMPYFQEKLPQDTIDVINCWNVQGALDN